MGNITASSLAAANAVSIENVQLMPAAEVLPRKILIIGTGDPATEAGNDLDIPVLVTSPEDVGARTGLGRMLHRLAVRAFQGSGGIETWMIQQPEVVAGVQAVGEVDFAGTTGVLAGTLSLYIAGIPVPVTIPAAATIENITDACVAAINAYSELPVTAAKHAVTFELDITSKSKGTWGNFITIAFNRAAGEVLPTGIVAAVTAMSTGAGIPDIQDALDSLGTGDNANENGFTDVIHGYGQDTTTLDAISNYVGPGNDAVGLYNEAVHKPFRSMVGDTASGSGGLSALVAIGGNRKEDRANGIIAVPGSYSHPSEIAALTIGIMAKISNNRPEQNYLDILLPDVNPGDSADRWTSEYNNRDTAVKAGISPTFVKSNAVYLQNVTSFYHPASVPVTSNGYRSMRNIAITQNILYNIYNNFEGSRWNGVTIVSDTNRVTNITARLKARDIDSVRDDLVALIRSFEQNAWLYSADYSINELRKAGQIAVRTGGDGFESIIKLIYSGEGNILDTLVQFDTSIAVTL